jgi:hypothetical protein
MVYQSKLASRTQVEAVIKTVDKVGHVIYGTRSMVCNNRSSSHCRATGARRMEKLNRSQFIIFV